MSSGRHTPKPVTDRRSAGVVSRGDGFSTPPQPRRIDLMNVRPHPGPLPQEREKRSPRLGGADAPGCRAVFPANDEAAAIATVTNEFSNNAASLPLSPGERAGVRASVKLTSAIPAHIRRYHQPRVRLMNDRPHPGQAQTLTRPAATLSHPMGEGKEKEKRSPRLGGTDALGCRAFFSTNDKAAAIAMVTNEFSSDATSLTLSPGERAGVRAVQITNLISPASTLRTSVKLTSLLFSFIQRLHRFGIIRQWMRRTGLQLAEDRVPNSLLVPPQVRVPKAQFLDAHRGEKPGSFGIVSLLVRLPVAAAVEFNRKARLLTEKIQKVFSNRMSASKFVGAEPSVAQPAPDELFSPILTAHSSFPSRRETFHRPTG